MAGSDVEFAIQGIGIAGEYRDVVRSGDAIHWRATEDGQFDVELDLATSRRGGVPMAHQRSGSGLPSFLDRISCHGHPADAGRLTDRFVVAQ